MTQPALHPARYEDLFDLPENVIGQIIQGQLIALPRPTPRHALVTSEIGMSIGNPFQKGRGGPGGWWILDEPELHLDTDILVPDVAGWRRERMPTLPEEAFFTLVPDWICEVLSPRSARLDRVVKMPIYAQQGVEWLWLADPNLHTLEVYRLLDRHWRLEGAWQEADVVQAPPFEDISLQLSDWWAA